MKNTETRNDISGILLVDKPAGYTSHDIVAIVRKRFHVKKVGHAGTLDPGATGVLVLLLGKATKTSDEHLGREKEYTATMKLGEKTDTGDNLGNIVKTCAVNVKESDIAPVMREFLGEIYQMPPMFSAKKINGKKLYKLARKGVTVERKPRKIFIDELTADKIEIPFISFRVVCGKGTYIRQLAEDIGERLGCCAHLTELRRIRSGDFHISDCVNWEDLMKIDVDLLSSVTRESS